MSLFDSTGKKKQALPDNAAQESGGNLETLATDSPTVLYLLDRILREQQITNRLLAQGLNLDDADIQTWRDDPNFS